MNQVQPLLQSWMAGSSRGEKLRNLELELSATRGFLVQRRCLTPGPSWCHFHEIPGGDPARSQVPLLNRR